MTPREKAEQLVNEFYHNNTDYIDSNSAAKESAITCALIAVEQILQTNPTIKGTSEDLLTQIVQTKAYYIQVAEEIQKL